MNVDHEMKLRALIRFLVEETEVLGEPDFVEEREDDADDEGYHDEASTGGVPGVTLPLGMGTKEERKKRRKDAWKANASGFGNAKLYKK